MRRLRSTDAFGALIAGLSIQFLLGSVTLAMEASSEQSAPVPCAVVEDLGGQVQILDSSRNHLSHAAQNTGIACGSWVSTGAAIGSGWARLKLRDGYQVHLGAKSFIGLTESNPDGHNTGDHLVIYRGQVYGSASGRTGELRIITANGRVRVKSGAAVVLFDEKEEETQLITLERVASLENRFQNTRQISVKAGEASSLNFKLLRVVPSSARVVSLAALRPKLADLHLEARDQKAALRLTQKRQERKIASEPTEHVVQVAHAKKRSPASKNYARHRTAKVDAKLRAYWIRKMSGGENVGERILYPDKFYGRPQKASVEVFDPNKKQADVEKRRLIEELQQIRED